MLKYKVFIINLARSPERLATMQSQLSAQGIDFERVDAVDGQRLSDEYIEEVAPAELIRRSYYRPLSKGEIACSLSHKNAWQQIIDDDLDFAIVLEDDVQINDNFKEVLQLITELPQGIWDFIKLYPLTRGSEKNIDMHVDYKAYRFVTYHKFPLGCQGQVISQRGAQALVANMPFIKEPVDSQLKSWWELGIFPFGLLPYCITTEVGGDSDINPEGRLEQIKQNKLTKGLIKVAKAIHRLRWQPKLTQQFKQFVNQLKQQ